MAPFAGTGLTLLIDAALRGTLVLLAASLLVISMRRGSAASRHLIWQLALLAVLALPVVKLVSPLRLAVLPAFRSPIAMPVAAPAPAPAPAQPQQRTELAVEEPVGSPSTLAGSTVTTPTTTNAAARPSLLVRMLFWFALLIVTALAPLGLR